MDSRDSQKMIVLAKEGKQISKIWREDFPQYDYWEVYQEIHGAGEKGALGVKKMITNRLNRLFEAGSGEREDIIDEVNDLVIYLYEQLKSNQKKLDGIRKALDQ